MSNLAIIECDNYPVDLCCPIGHDLLIDPVIISDGHTYEKENIIKWLSSSRKSPLTHEYVSFSFHVGSQCQKKEEDGSLVVTNRSSCYRPYKIISKGKQK